MCVLAALFFRQNVLINSSGKYIKIRNMGNLRFLCVALSCAVFATDYCKGSIESDSDNIERKIDNFKSSNGKSENLKANAENSKDTLHSESAKENLGDLPFEVLKRTYLFKQFLKTRHLEHKKAVDTLLAFEKYEKKYKMAKLMLERMADSLSQSKDVIVAAEYEPGSPVPEKETTKKAFTAIVEHIALFAELLLRVPDITHSILNMKNKWRGLLEWGLHFSVATGMYDVKTKEKMYMVSQELSLTVRDPNYVNPYNTQKAPEEKAGVKKRKKQVKGPRMAKSEL